MAAAESSICADDPAMEVRSAPGPGGARGRARAPGARGRGPARWPAVRRAVERTGALGVSAVWAVRERTGLSELTERAATSDPLFFAIVERRSRRALGMASFLRVEQGHGVIEVGHIWYSPALQRTQLATEAMYVMARHVFDDLGYRRYEWKCNALNEPSRRAAVRLGFTFEGVFRQHMVIKGGNRDTAWYSMLDGEWPAAKAAFEAWLRPDNFDAEGRQLRSLAELRMVPGQR